jgi:hypothetical protein
VPLKTVGSAGIRTLGTALTQHVARAAEHATPWCGAMPGTSSGRTQAPRRSHDWLGFDCAKTDECITRGNSPPSALLPSLPQHLGGTHRYVLYHISAVRATQRLYRTSLATRVSRVARTVSSADRVSHPVDRPRPSLHVPHTLHSAQIDSHRAVKSSHECTDLRIDSTEFIMHISTHLIISGDSSTGLNLIHILIEWSGTATCRQSTASKLLHL